MSTQDFADIAQVVEYEHASDVNKLLEAGWRLLNVYNHTYNDNGAQQVIYVLGWPRSAGVPVDPVQVSEERYRREQEETRRQIAERKREALTPEQLAGWTASNPPPWREKKKGE